MVSGLPGIWDVSGVCLDDYFHQINGREMWGWGPLELCFLNFLRSTLLGNYLRKVEWGLISGWTVIIKWRSWINIYWSEKSCEYEHIILIRCIEVASIDQTNHESVELFEGCWGSSILLKGERLLGAWYNGQQQFGLNQTEPENRGLTV